MTKIVNLYGGPGLGKSTTAAHVFALLKQQHKSVELVTEYAKDLVWGNQVERLVNDQLYVLAEQHFRIKRLIGKVDVVINDGPILHSLHYGSYYGPTFQTLVKELYDKMDNLDIVLLRNLDIVYTETGRMQSSKAAQDIDDTVYELVYNNCSRYHAVPVNATTSQNIIQIIEDNHKWN